MTGFNPLLAVLLIFGPFVFFIWSLQRSRPSDRSAIDAFTTQRGLRIISVTRSRTRWRYWLRGIGISTNARIYVATVEDSEGNPGSIHVAFEPLFGSGRLEVLEQRGVAISVSGEPISWTWYEWLILFVIGAGLGGFIFSGFLQGYFSPLNRPLSPDLARGYTHLFKAKHGDLYGTYFEYVTVTCGIWIGWGLAAVGGLFGHFLGVHQKSRTSFRQLIAAVVISMALYYIIWKVCV
jgi:hypothetical protein